jgi:putative intracellular protease/amidase
MNKNRERLLIGLSVSMSNLHPTKKREAPQEDKVRGIKKGALAVMILLMLVAGQAFSAESKGQVLVILRPGMGSMEGFGIVDYTIIKEFGVMKTTLEGAGFNVVVATVDGRALGGKHLSITPDLKFSDVKIADYKGVMVPCMSAAAIPVESVQIVKDALAAGIPVAAQNGGVIVLSMAGGLKGKNFAMSDYFITGEGKPFFNPGGGTCRGDGVVQDGKIVTSGICPDMALFVKKPDGTLDLTQKLIALMQ